MKRKLLQVLLLNLLAAGSLQAQSGKKVTDQTLAWFRLYNHLTFAKNWEWNMEIENRRYIFPDAQHQFVVRNYVGRKLPNGWSAALGFTYFRQTLPHEPEATETFVVPELRPQQELSYKQKLTDRIDLSHRYWLEERFFRHVDSEGNLQDGYDFNFRFRYRLQANISLIKKETRKGALSLKAFDEIHLNFGKRIIRNTFDQNRIGGSLVYGLTKNIELEGGYFNWFQERSSGDDYYNRHIFRFTLHHYVSL